jgi:hypothetical protein
MEPAGFNQTPGPDKNPSNVETFLRGLIIAQGFHPGKWALRKSRLFLLRPSIAAEICEQNARSLLATLA